MLTTQALEKRLGQTRNAADDLIAVGLLNPDQAHKLGRVMAWPDQIAEDLDWPQVTDTHPGALVVKVKGRKSVDDDDRDHVGWTPHLHPMNPEQVVGIDRWWRVSNAATFVGQAFLPVTRGFVLAVYEITGTYQSRGQWRFELAEPTVQMNSAFQGRRVLSRPGPMIERLEATT